MSGSRTGLNLGSDTDHCPDCGRLRYYASGVMYHFATKMVACAGKGGDACLTTGCGA